MYELIQISDHCYYIQSPAKIGIVKLNEHEVCLIDSGNDKDAGKKIKKVLDSQGWTLTAIYNTHSNADHIGGNKYLQTQTGCKIYAPGIEQAFTKYPVLEPSYLYGGFPSKDLRHKFLMAQESDVELLTEEKLPKGMKMIPLPGHFFDMVGFQVVEDDVIYLADCLSSKMTIDKYQISVLYDVESYKKTLEMVKEMKAKVFVPSHAEACEDISELAQYNIDKVLGIEKKILELCAEPISFENLLQKLFDVYHLKMSFEQHVLIGSTVRSYLSYMKDKGELTVFFDHNLMLWHKTEEK